MEIREIRTELRVRHVEITDKGDKMEKGKIRCENKSYHDITSSLNNSFQRFELKGLLHHEQRVV